MRILALTAGAANMYCGSCMRDNALARELIRQGHDITLVPMYTPIRTDDENVSGERVFFGGISIYLQQKFPLFRYLPDWSDKLWDSNWALRLATKNSIEVDPRSLGELTVSTLKGEKGFQRKEIRKLTDWLKTEPRYDVVALPYTLLISLAEPIKRALGVPIVCTLQGEDLFLESLLEPYRTECLKLIRDQLRHVDKFIAVSEYYGGFMADFLGIEPGRIAVVPLGIDLTGHEALPKPPSGKLRVGFFARTAPEKGLHILCEAVALMKQPVDLRVAGYLPPENRAYFDELQAKYKFAYQGSPDREGKIRFLQSIDVLSVPSEYHEAKGTFVMEAMANGTPVVEPAHGAFVEIVTTTGGGLLTDPGSRADLASKLDDLARNRDTLATLSRNAVIGVNQHYSVRAEAERVAEVYRTVMNA